MRVDFGVEILGEVRTVMGLTSVALVVEMAMEAVETEIEIEFRSHTWSRLMAHTTGQRRAQECTGAKVLFFDRLGTITLSWASE